VEGIYPLVDRIYAGAVSSEAWRSTLGGFASFFRGAHSIMFAHGPDGSAADLAACFGIDDSDMVRWQTPDAVQLAEPLNNKVPFGRAIRWRELIDEREWQRSEYYNELVRPMGGFYAVAVRQKLAGLSFMLVTCRGRQDGAFDDDESAVLQRLLPHLTTALQLMQRLQVTEARAAGLSQTLDRLTAGLILTDAAARPLFVNARAAKIADEGDGLLVSDFALAAATPEATRELRVATAAVAADTAAGGRHLRLERPSRRPPLLLTLLPVGRAEFAMPGLPVPRVAVFIKEARPSRDIDPAVVAEALRLTPRESEVATLLAKGIGLDGIAAQLDLAVGTVRNHLKRALDKTDTRSQAALVSLVCGLSTTWN
jgi:DNA-binding CsgD family transcriptional regulator